jgi:hypothetical protein
MVLSSRSSVTHQGKATAANWMFTHVLRKKHQAEEGVGSI